MLRVLRVHDSRCATRMVSKLCIRQSDKAGKERQYAMIQQMLQATTVRVVRSGSANLRPGKEKLSGHKTDIETASNQIEFGHDHPMRHHTQQHADRAHLTPTKRPHGKKGVTESG